MHDWILVPTSLGLIWYFISRLSFSSVYLFRPERNLQALTSDYIDSSEPDLGAQGERRVRVFAVSGERDRRIVHSQGQFLCPLDFLLTGRPAGRPSQPTRPADLASRPGRPAFLLPRQRSVNVRY